MKTKFTNKILKEIVTHPGCMWVKIEGSDDQHIHLGDSVEWDWDSNKLPPLDLVIKSLVASAYNRGKADCRADIKSSLSELKDLLDD